MSSDMKKITLYIDNMTCVNCENTIERALKGIAGIENAKASYSSGTVKLSFNPDLISLDKIKELIEAHDYHVSLEKMAGNSGRKTETGSEAKAGSQLETGKADKELDLTDIAAIGIIIFALYILMRRMGLTNIFNAFPLAREGMGYGMLFIIGLMTSVHCVAMCGGICLTQCAGRDTDSRKAGKMAALRPSLLYNTGRVVSYTVVGAVVGALGSVISFSGTMKGSVQIAAGLFMIIMGFNLLGLFPSLRRFTPRMPKIFAKGIYRQRDKAASPFIIGLLNGLMPCGPLQAMQLYALSTGDPLKGAFSMFLFSAGTFPLMFAFGALSSLLSKKFTGKVMKLAAILVLLLGISMFRNGAALSGLTLPVFPGESKSSATLNIARIEDGIQVVKSGITPGSYEPIIVQKGIPVRWIIQAEEGEINGCNNSIIIPAFGVHQDLSEGDTIVEFMPDRSGNFTFSCWMGMIRSRITVVDDIKKIDINY